MCLCGNVKCRGSFLHYARADQYQRVLHESNGIAVRFASLLKCCMKNRYGEDDSKILAAHGFDCAAFGAIAYFKDLQGKEDSSLDRVPTWLKSSIADVLRYVEYERKALPISLLCDNRERLKRREMGEVRELEREGAIVDEVELTYEIADNEGRAGMERRILDLIATMSLVGRTLARQEADDVPPPLRILSKKEVIIKLWMDEDSVVRNLVRSALLAGTNGTIIDSMKEVLQKFSILAPGNEATLDDPTTLARAYKTLKSGLLYMRYILLVANDVKDTVCVQRHRAAADLLLFYANTDTFVQATAYKSFESSPITVYSRELGNEVPRSVMRAAKSTMPEGGRSGPLQDKVDILMNCPTPRSSPVKKSKLDCSALLRFAELRAIGKKYSGVTIGKGAGKWKAGAKYESQAIATFINQEEAAMAVDLCHVFFKYKSEEEESKSGEELNIMTRAQCEEWWLSFATVHLCVHRKVPLLELQPEIKAQVFTAVEQMVENYVRPKEVVKAEDCADPDESVATVTKVYKPAYVLNTLLHWFKGGAEVPTNFPFEEMTGCLGLPDFTHLYSRELAKGRSDTEATRGVGTDDSAKKGKPVDSFRYGVPHREKMYEWGTDQNKRNTGWDKDLLDVFGVAGKSGGKSGTDESFIFGSPLLDLLLTNDDQNLAAVMNVFYVEHAGGPELAAKSNKRKVRGGGEKVDLKEERGKLMGAVNDGNKKGVAKFNWVQCEDENCMKWRKLPWFVDPENDLPEIFLCSDNKWEEEKAFCEAPEDVFDANAEATQASLAVGEAEIIEGACFDFRCEKMNNTYQVGQVQSICRGGTMIVVKFIRMEAGYKQQFPLDPASSKVAPLHFHTKVSDEERKERGVGMGGGGEVVVAEAVVAEAVVAEAVVAEAVVAEAMVADVGLSVCVDGREKRELEGGEEQGVHKQQKGLLADVVMDTQQKGMLADVIMDTSGYDTSWHENENINVN